MTTRSLPMDEPRKKNPLGPTGETVANNIRRLREAVRMPVTELSRRLGDIGRPIPTLGLRKIEFYERRVDADDLVALAAALGVSPITLLMPFAKPDDPVTITGQQALLAKAVWEWLIAAEPLPGGGDMVSFAQYAWPVWERERFAAEFRSAASSRTHSTNRFPRTGGQS